jgi:hypothetical protein
MVYGIISRIMLCICPEFSLPLSVWLNSGWNGFLLRWWADLCAARQAGRKECEVIA